MTNEEKIKEMGEYLSFIEKDIPKLIPSDEILSIRSISQLRELSKLHGKTKLMSLLTNPNSDKFKVEHCCSKCYRPTVIKLSKTTLIDYLGGRCYQMCEKCEKEKKEIESKEQKDFYEKQKNEKVEQTQNFINEYLNPDFSWKSGISMYDAFKSLERKYAYTDHIIIQEHVKKMSYYDFLKTPYWKAVSHRRKHIAGYKCQLCSSNKNLHTHHSTYSIKGAEIYNMKELTVLCEECHEKFHNKIPQN